MRNILLLFSVMLFWAACKKDVIHPVLEVSSTPIENYGLNDIDKRRLCLGQLLSKALLDDDIRHYLKEQSVWVGKNYNREILLIQHLDVIVTSGMTFRQKLQAIIEANGQDCIKNIAEVEDVLRQDPLLALKIPDLILADEWNTDKEIPLVYVQTTDFAKRADSGIPFKIGIHASGFVDRYTGGIPAYFPIILKNSEDYVAINSHLVFYNGIDLRSLHTPALAVSETETFFSEDSRVGQTSYFIEAFNSLLDKVNMGAHALQSPNPIDDCGEVCAYACIAPANRKLLAKRFTVDNRNANAMEYEFASALRFNGHLIFNESITPLFVTGQFSSNAPPQWNRSAFGAYRFLELYDVAVEHSVTPTTYSINGRVFDLPVLTAEVDVTGIKDVAVAHLLLADGVVPDDLLRIGIYRLSLDWPSLYNGIIDENPVTAAFCQQDNITNYDLYCVKEGTAFGFNSPAIICGM